MERKKSYPRPKSPLGPYTKPTITRVKLDPKQAILATCATYQQGGAWMVTAIPVCVYNAGGGTRTPAGFCAFGMRGQVTVSTSTYDRLDQPGS